MTGIKSSILTVPSRLWSLPSSSFEASEVSFSVLFFEPSFLASSFRLKADVMESVSAESALSVPFYFMLCAYGDRKDLCNGAFKNEPAAMNNPQNTVDFKDYDLTYPIL